MMTIAAPIKSARAVRKGLRGFMMFCRPVIGPYTKEITVAEGLQLKR